MVTRQWTTILSKYGSPSGLRVMPDELGGGNGAVLGHLHDVVRVYGEIRGEVGGPGRRQLRHLRGNPCPALPHISKPTTSEPGSNDLFMTHPPDARTAAGVRTAAIAQTDGGCAPCRSLFFERANLRATCAGNQATIGDRRRQEPLPERSGKPDGARESEPPKLIRVVIGRLWVKSATVRPVRASFGLPIQQRGACCEQSPPCRRPPTHCAPSGRASPLPIP